MRESVYRRRRSHRRASSHELVEARRTKVPIVPPFRVGGGGGGEFRACLAEASGRAGEEAGAVCYGDALDGSGALSLVRVRTPFLPMMSKRLDARSCHCFSPVAS